MIAALSSSITTAVATATGPQEEDSVEVMPATSTAATTKPQQQQQQDESHSTFRSSSSSSATPSLVSSRESRGSSSSAASSSTASRSSTTGSSITTTTTRPCIARRNGSVGKRGRPVAATKPTTSTTVRFSTPEIALVVPAESEPYTACEKRSAWYTGKELQSKHHHDIQQYTDYLNNKSSSGYAYSWKRHSTNFISSSRNSSGSSSKSHHHHQHHHHHSQQQQDNNTTTTGGTRRASAPADCDTTTTTPATTDNTNDNNNTGSNSPTASSSSSSSSSHNHHDCWRGLEHHKMQPDYGALHKTTTTTKRTAKVKEIIKAVVAQHHDCTTRGLPLLNDELRKSYQKRSRADKLRAEQLGLQDAKDALGKIEVVKDLITHKHTTLNKSPARQFRKVGMLAKMGIGGVVGSYIHC